MSAGQNVQKLSDRLTYLLLRGFHYPCLQIRQNPSVWATDKTVVPTVMVHSCLNITKGNCLCCCHHTSEFPAHFWWLHKDGQWNSYFISHW